MAEVVGLVASALTIAGVAASAVQLSQALFTVAQTLKNAPQEIAEIAEEIQTLSGSLLTLDDFIEAHQSLFKPALFQNTKSILSRYVQVDKELRMLIDTPSKLVRLKWCIKRPKAKNLLKKVEAIKTALSLELSIVRLAREEFVRPILADSNVDQALQTPNRFRKLVESAVQANRQVIQSAQVPDAQDSVWKTRRIGRKLGKELGVWREGSFDTATWLYHLVFSPPVPLQSMPSGSKPYQASVSDENSEQPISMQRMSSNSNTRLSGATIGDTAMIIWGRQTEPRLVIDRLLSDWTELTAAQIKQSSIRQDEDEWMVTFDNMVTEAKKEEDAEAKELESLCAARDDVWTHQTGATSSSASSEEDSDSYSAIAEASCQQYSRARHEMSLADTLDTHRNRHSERSVTNDTLDSITLDDDKSWYDDSGRKRTHLLPSRQVHFEDLRKPISRPLESDANAYMRTKERSAATTLLQRGNLMPGTSPTWTLDSASGRTFTPNNSSHRYSTQIYNPFTALPNGSANSLPPPFPGQHEFQYPTGSIPNGPWNSSQPAQNLVSVSSNSDTQPPRATLHTTEKEETVISAIEKLLVRQSEIQKPDPEDSTWSKLMQFLVAQQERQIETDQANAKAAMEAASLQAQATRDRDEKITNLENLIKEQREEQRLVEISWKAEKTAQDEKIATQIQEAKERTEKDVAAVYSANKSLEFEKYKAERKAEAQRQDQVRKDQRRIETDQRQRLNRIEDAISSRNENSNQHQQSNGPFPVRHTCIREGGRSIEVAEFTAGRTGPLINTPLEPSTLYEGVFFSKHGVGTLGQIQAYSGIPERLRSSMYSSNASLDHSNTTSSTESEKRVIVLPSNIDRKSATTLQLQASIAEAGAEAIFDDLGNTSRNHQIVPYQLKSIEVTQSTLLWEAPTLGMRSELLSTMKQAGWKPFYVRASDSGQTFFHGNEPIHTYIFRSDYKPQFTALSDSSPGQSFVIINSAFVEASVMEDLGHQYKYDETGVYILDGRLAIGDIDDLIERSFSTRETRFRKTYRRPVWQHDATEEKNGTATEKSFSQSSQSSTPNNSFGKRTPYREIQVQPQTSSLASDQGSRQLHVEKHSVSSTDDDDIPSLRTGSPSIPSPSVASWSSKSSRNPYNLYISPTRERKDQQGGSRMSLQNFWDDPLLH